MACKEKILEFKNVISAADEGRVVEVLSEKADVAYSFDDIALLKKVAVNTSDDDFVTFYQTGELPAIELSQSEMEMIHGGGWIKGALKVLEYGAYLAAAYLWGYEEGKDDCNDP